MSKFNKLEREIANILSEFPYLKKYLKLFYQYVNYFIYKKSYKFRSKANIVSFATRGQESFFGYYDKSPQNSNGFTLGHLSEYSTCQKPDPNKPLKIALFKPENYNSPEYEVETKAYNWQQGARLQWLNDNFFIFNDFDGNNKRYISRVYSKESIRELKKFDYAVQDSFGTEYFLSLNYRRLLTLRPDYGYRCLPPLTGQEIKNIEGDGIWKVDFETGEGDLILTLSDIIQCEYDTHFEKGKHYVNHVMISPKGDNFIFLHRYKVRGQRFDRLLVAGSKGQKLKVLADNEMVSHCCWIDNDTILGYLRNDKGKDGFYIIDIESGKYANFANGSFDNNGDGHPHAYDNWFVCDSYPDKSRMQHLTLNNIKTGKSIQLGEFFHGFKFKGETRCDLHPRFSPDGQSIFVDSVYDGKRKLKEIDISELLKND